MARRISVEIVGNSASLERSFRRASSSAAGFNRDMGRAGRGIASVAVGYRSLGRSIAFASSAFVGAAGVAVGVRAAVEGAESLRKAQDSARAAIQHTGESVDALMPKYRGVAAAAAGFGVSQASALAGLAKATALTGSSGAALRAYQEALVLSKGAHVSFESALTATSKGQEGITTSLRRYGVLVSKTTSGQEQFRLVMARFGGQARANTSDLDRLRANAANLAAQVGGPLLRALEAAARGLSGVVSRFQVFADRLGGAHTFHAKLAVVWDGVEGVGRGLVQAFSRVDWAGAGRALAGEVSRLSTFLRGVDYAAVGREVGSRIGRVLARVGDFVGRVDWSQVGKAIIDGLAAATVVAVNALPGVLGGIGRIVARLLVASLALVGGAARELGRGIVAGISKGFEAAARALEGLALKAVLKIVEPFTHLPGFLGGGPFRALKDSLQRQLDGMEKAAQDTAAAISTALSGATVTGSSAAEKAAAPHGFTAPASPVRAAVGKATQAQVAQAAGTAAAAAASTVEKGFALPFRLQLAQARAAASQAAGDDLAVARQVRGFIVKAIPRLHGQKLLDAYSQLGQANDAIAQALEKAKTFTVPASLQLAQARAEALGKPFTGILEKMRAAAEKALKSGKLGVQGQIDAWNEIASINQQLQGSTASALGGFKQLNTRKLAESFGLTGDALRRLRAALSQVGPGGTIPSQGVGAFGVAFGADNRPIVVQHETKLDGRVIERSTTKFQQKRRRRNPPQVRGPFAGGLSAA